jgi:DNA repair protein RadA/Sms
MKIKKRFVCKECGYFSPMWIGKCPECLNWNSFIEEILDEKKDNIKSDNFLLVKSTDIESHEKSTIKFEIDQINDFFGEGIVAGSVILIAGEPGIGKSTFILFLSKSLNKNLKIYYYSGEESVTQINRRILRLEIKNENLFLSNQNNLEKIMEDSTYGKPDMIFIDSIQTICSAEVDSGIGSVTQIRYCTDKLTQYAKKSSTPVVLVGHITKSGEIAGPKIIEHIVDMVIYFEGDFQNQFRILRAVKNRFGSIDEILIFQMKTDGLKLIENPSNFFIEKDLNSKSLAKCKGVIIEGQRPLIVEVEALVVPSIYTNPRRFTEGVDVARINRISAILNKHLNENFNNYDIYFNISGGIKTKDVGIDLAIAIAIYSSKHNKEINNDYMFIGELSLTGNIRNVIRLDQRINEAFKFGINCLFIPRNSDINYSRKEIVQLQDIKTSISEIFI